VTLSSLAGRTVSAVVGADVAVAVVVAGAAVIAAVVGVVPIMLADESGGSLVAGDRAQPAKAKSIASSRRRWAVFLMKYLQLMAYYSIDFRLGAGSGNSRQVATINAVKNSLSSNSSRTRYGFAPG
jgi:hypothetical protein